VIGARFIRVTRPAELRRTALDGLKPALWSDFFDLRDLISIVRYPAAAEPKPAIRHRRQLEADHLATINPHAVVELLDTPLNRRHRRLIHNTTTKHEGRT
jgi:hypothetical protein